MLSLTAHSSFDAGAVSFTTLILTLFTAGLFGYAQSFLPTKVPIWYNSNAFEKYALT